mmetsp:Transcript_37013/g.109094  ORF Transcript_37013/g.109094 Transcript_37013/m.109094 type:complete len:615 (-) Transcript_37013:439-2283(-)
MADPNAKQLDPSPTRQKLPGSYVPSDVLAAGAGAVGFAITAIWCSQLRDPAVTELYGSLVDKEWTYLVPATCFFTAFVLSLLTMVFERDTQRFRLAFFGAYIQILAASNDFLAYMDMAPIVRGSAYGSGVNLLRYVMWAFTTPAMIYLISLMSDSSTAQILLAIAADIVMIVSGLLGSVLQSVPLSAFCMLVSFAMFPYVMSMQWVMFQSAISATINCTNERSLRMLRIFTLSFWFSFPIIWLAGAAGLLSPATEEAMWTVSDFCGKVMFSSSLLYGNFLTLEQRKLITMRVIEESNRIQVIQELKDLIEQKDMFMNGMTHELRTPLNGIIGLTESLLIGSCGAMTSSVAKILRTIKGSGIRLLTFVNDMLDAASVRKGVLTIKQERVNLEHLVHDITEICVTLPRRGVALKCDIPAKFPHVRGDADRIIQMLHNLVGNACKFTHTGSITVGASLEGPDARVSVTDTGIGIPADKLLDIFDPFKQVDKKTTRKYGGTGLGLSLVKQLAMSHGSDINVESTLGHGSKFSFTLKVWDASDSQQVGRSNSTRTSSGSEESLPTLESEDVYKSHLVQEVATLKKERILMEEQMEEISAECARLQEANDLLEERLAGEQ